MPFIGYLSDILVTSVTTFGFPLYFFSTHLSAAMFIRWQCSIIISFSSRCLMYDGGIKYMSSIQSLNRL